ncbi:MAG: ATP synthase F1 subunit epsilon [Planctomycetota bacterium]
MATFRCTIVTPTAEIFDDQVTYASVPAWDGQLGVMVGQSPLLSRLGIGGLRVDYADGSSRSFLIDGGFAQVHREVLTLIADDAIPVDSISLEDARAELAEANSRVAASGEDQVKVTADQQRAMAKIALASSS